jgi:diadenosine tetraphosphate (Ap4A) HIT family hydrolase
VEDCELCRPADVVFDGELAYVRRDSNALSRGHVLVVPKRHVADFFGMSAEEQAGAGQARMHVHVHLIPRYAGDVPDPRGGIRCVLKR